MKKSKHFSHQLFLSYSILIIGVLGLFSVLYFSLASRFEYNESAKMQYAEAQNVQMQIDESLKKMDGIINSLLFNNHFMQIVRNNSDGTFSENDKSAVLNYFVSLDAPYFTTHRIIAFSNNYCYSWSKMGDEPYYVNVISKGYSRKKQITDQDGRRVILPPENDPFSPLARPVYTVARSITDGNTCFGILEVQENYNNITKICSLHHDNQKIFVINSEGDIIYPFNSEEPSPDWERLGLIQLASDNGNGMLQNGYDTLFFSKSSYSEIISIVSVPSASLYEQRNRTSLIIIMQTVITGIICLTVTYLVTRKLSQPLVELNSAVSKVSLDNLKVCIPSIHGITEIDSLNHSFQQTFHQLEISIANKLQAQKNEQEANYLALESQMSPHTLYNSIGIIESVCYINGDTEAANLCVCLSKMLRYISDYSSRTYTVRDEIQHLRSYAALIEKRHVGKLKIEIEAEPELLSCVLPKLTLQPLVENAVKYGLPSKICPMVIRVSAHYQPGGWYVMVMDTGCGFTPERLAEIRSRIEECCFLYENKNEWIKQPIGNLGLINICSRCCMLSKNRFKMEIGNNHESEGAYVKLLFLN